MVYNFKMEKDEFWWGGTSADGISAPFDSSTEINHDFTQSSSNQAMPMYLSSKGRCIWSENPFKVEISGGNIKIEGEDVSIESFGSTLKEAYVGAMNKYFSPSGERLSDDFFKVAQYNTWMQMTYNQTQEGVMEYARGILENGFEPGILMIDEGWQVDYGDWRFDKLKFPDPKKMVDELHSMGFKIMLWVVPYVRPDGLVFVNHTEDYLCPDLYDRYFLRYKNGKPALLYWWNGYSAVLDFTKQCDCDFLGNQLDALMDEIGIDGFKFDGGNIGTYSGNVLKLDEISDEHTAMERNIAWNKFGTSYKYHEFKDTFKGGGKWSVQRLCDRNHSWDDNGLNTLIPSAIMQGIIGHPFICPDMIGGGSWIVREHNLPVDQELFVRMAQCSALFPMMQFSWAPWEAVDDYHLELIKKAQDLHCEFSEAILNLVENAYESGEPIIRSLEYNYPNCGYEKINDIFMLGDEYVVAPIIVKGQTEKQIPLPEGKWLGYDGKEYDGNQMITLSVTLEDLPYFKKL